MGVLILRILLFRYYIRVPCLGKPPYGLSRASTRTSFRVHAATFREILWQPDVFTEVSSSLPPLRILKAFCIETIDEIKEIDSPLSSLYVGLIKGVGRCASKAITELEKEKPDVRKILGDLRTCTFPIIKFFIHHPQNRQDYFMDATNRLNYAVKIMLTQFHGRYTDLEDPYWKVSFAQSKLPKKSEVISDEQ